MGKSTPQAPTPPDPYATANAQTQQNVGTAQANSILSNADVHTPQGSSTFSQIGSQSIQVPDGRGGFTSIDVPRWQNTQSLSPTGQHQFEQQQQLGTQQNDLAINQLSRLGNTLSQPISTSGLPDRVNNLGSLPNLRNLSLDRMGGPALGVQTNPGLNSQFGNTGQAQTSFANAGGQTSSFNDVGGPQRTVGPTDYSADRQSVVDALNSRLNPQLDRDRASLENNLTNQGFQRGTQAFTDAMDQFGRQSNDAHIQNILAGGQEQSRLANLDFTRFGLQNQAQAQDFGQAQSRGQFANDAQQRAYDQSLGRGQFGNQAQQQNYTQALGRGQFANDANLATAQFGNAAQQQQFGQQMDVGNFNNNAQAQEAGFNNQNAMGLYGLNAQNAGFQNASRDAGIQEQLAMRNQPINEISALMSGGQVSQPQFAQYQGGNVGQTDLQGGVYNTAALNQQNYQTQLANQTAQRNALIGGLAGLGGAGLYGLGTGNLRLPRAG